MWWNKVVKLSGYSVRHYSRSKKVQPPRVIRVTNNVAHLGRPRKGPKPRQLLSLPPFPGHPLPGRNPSTGLVTAISWLKYYFHDIPGDVVQSHLNKGLVSITLSFSLFPFFYYYFLIFPSCSPFSFVTWHLYFKLFSCRCRWKALIPLCPRRVRECKQNRRGRYCCSYDLLTCQP